MKAFVVRASSSSPRVVIIIREWLLREAQERPWENKLFSFFFHWHSVNVCLPAIICTNMFKNISPAPRNAYKFKSPSFNLDNNYLWRRLLRVSRGPFSTLLWLRSRVITSERKLCQLWGKSSDSAELIFHEKHFHSDFCLISALIPHSCFMHDMWTTPLEVETFPKQISSWVNYFQTTDDVLSRKSLSFHCKREDSDSLSREEETLKLHFSITHKLMRFKAINQTHCNSLARSFFITKFID